MKLIILKSDISTAAKEEDLRSILTSHPYILDWSVDREDIDNVLRIEASDEVNEERMISFIRINGCEVEDLA